MSIPAIKNDSKGIPTLYINDTPFFCRSGEIHNSSASDLKYMATKVWPNLRGLNMNSVIAPVYWECLELEKGKYNFELVDGLIEQARAEGMKLIFLWFGLWKNSESMYIPGWMKKENKKYFYVENVNGKRINTISPLCHEGVERDKAAFAALMKHLREFDKEQSTVITIQVENEIGVLGTERDYSHYANELFESRIPKEMAVLFGTAGPWREAFKDDAEEYFMAYYYAKAVEEITAAGRKEYPLPCYVNAWLKQYPWYKGSYPTGGPVKSVFKIWKKFAPSLFTLGPDIYVPYCADVMDEYAIKGNPLFIPEIRKDAVTASYSLYAMLGKNAICYSPFGIEDLSLDPSSIEKPPMDVMLALNIDPSAMDITGSKKMLADAYQLLENLEPLYLEMRGTDHLKSVIRHGENDFGAFLTFSQYDLTVAYAPRIPAKPLGSLTAFELSENKFLLVGTECSVTFRVKPGERTSVGYVRLEDGTVTDGKWDRTRILNGDEMMSIKFGDMPRTYMVEVFKY